MHVRSHAHPPTHTHTHSQHPTLPPVTTLGPWSFPSDTCNQEIISSWDLLRKRTQVLRGAAPPSFPVSPRPRAPCLPGSKLQGSLLPRHQEGVGELCVSQLPHLLGIRGRGSDSRPHPQALWWGGRRIAPQGQFKQRDKDGELVQWLLVQPSKGAPSWPRSTEQMGPEAPGTPADKPVWGRQG